jgi:hypothetical protein
MPCAPPRVAGAQAQPVPTARVSSSCRLSMLPARLDARILSVLPTVSVRHVPPSRVIPARVQAFFSRFHPRAILTIVRPTTLRLLRSFGICIGCRRVTELSACIRGARSLHIWEGWQHSWNMRVLPWATAVLEGLRACPSRAC